MSSARNLDDLRRIVQTLTQRGVHIEFVKEHFSFTAEEANRWSANPLQHTTSGLEYSRGQQRTEIEKQRKARLERRLPEDRTQEAKARNRANTGGTDKEIPTGKG